MRSHSAMWGLLAQACASVGTAGSVPSGLAGAVFAGVELVLFLATAGAGGGADVLRAWFSASLISGDLPDAAISQSKSFWKSDLYWSSRTMSFARIGSSRSI